MTVENLVPPLEMCKQIPDGEFAESAFVWTQEMAATKLWFVAHREDVEFCRKKVTNAPDVYPAPTLAEIQERRNPSVTWRSDLLNYLVENFVNLSNQHV